MAADLSGFGKIAHDLARNPLGIIALFIVLIYGFAALLMGNTASVLTPGQGYILIIFLAGFPIIVLITFAWLVSQHHAKLYAPTDYKSDEAFLQTLTPTQTLQRLQREVEIEQFNQQGTSVPQELSQAAEVRQLRSSPSDMMSRVRQVEDLVFRKLESEIKHPIQREVKILGTGDLGVFDGAIIEPKTMTLIEVKYTRTSFLPSYLIRDILYRAILAVQKSKEIGGPADIRVLLIVVTDQVGTDQQRFKARMEGLLKDAPVPVEIRFYEFDELSATQENG